MIKQAVDAFAAASGRTFSTDRLQTVGASEVGQCARKVYWLKNEGDPVYGAERDAGFVDTWGARARGTIYEDHWWAPAMRAAYGDKLHFAGDQQQTFVSGFLSATPDGLVSGLPRNALAHLGIADIGSNCVLTECKTADPRTKLSEAKAENVFQTQVQMGLVRERTPWKPEYTVISYTDASFWNEVLEFPVSFDSGVYRAAKDRAATIMTATSASELKPEGWIAGGRECDFCPFTKACGVARTSVPAQNDEEPDPQFIAEIADLARQAKEIEAHCDGLSVELKTIQHEIRERLRAKGQRRIVGHGMSVSWSPVKGRQSWDNKGIREAAAKAGVDLAAFETTGEPTDRLVIQAAAQSRAAA